jgi:putative tricarboxylic transport membrane protein
MIRILGLIGAVLCCLNAQAQGWSPQKNVEIVANSAPGGSNDKTARTLEHVLMTLKLAPTSLTVVNKAGGGGSIGYTYLAQHAGDPHYLMVAGDGLLSNHVLGASKLNYTDFTPLALLFNDYVVMAVNADSPIRNGRDFAERLKKNPQGVAIGFANAFGSTRHISLALLMKALGGNPRDLKVVVFKGSAEAITALLGGHLDAVAVGATNATAHLATGRMRVVGPKGLTVAQTAYWEQTFRKVSESADWKADLDRNYWTSDFRPGAAFAKELEKDYAEMRTVLTDAGLVKQP